MENRPILHGVMRGGFVDAHNLTKDLLIELRKSGRRKGYPSVARAIYRSLGGFINARRRYPDVKVPVTLIYSEQDWSLPAERDDVASLLTDVGDSPSPNRPFLALERPDDVARILLALDGTPPADGATHRPWLDFRTITKSACRSFQTADGRRAQDQPGIWSRQRIAQIAIDALLHSRIEFHADRDDCVDEHRRPPSWWLRCRVVIN